MKLYVYTLRDDPFVFGIPKESDAQKFIEWWVNVDGKSDDNIGLIGSTLIRRDSIIAIGTEE